MTPATHRWDPSTPGFVPAVLRTLLGLLVVCALVGAAAFPAHLGGITAGGLLAVALLLAAIQAGRVFAASGRFDKTMFWLLMQQFIIWAGMALIFLMLRVSAVGFAVGVSILPVGILLTLCWYLWKARGQSS